MKVSKRLFSLLVCTLIIASCGATAEDGELSTPGDDHLNYVPEGDFIDLSAEVNLTVAEIREDAEVVFVVTDQDLFITEGYSINDSSVCFSGFLDQDWGRLAEGSFLVIPPAVSDSGVELGTGSLWQVSYLTDDEEVLDFCAEPAFLEDIYEEVEFSLEHELAPNEFAGEFTPSIEGATCEFGIQTALRLIHCSLEKVILVQDGLELKANGDFSLSMDYELMVKIASGHREFRLVFNVKESGELALVGTGEGSFEVGPIEIGSIKTQPYKFNIGVLPVWIRGVLTLYLGADGSVTARFESSISQEAGYDAGVHYLNGEWDWIHDWNPEPTWNVTPFDWEVDASLTGYAEAELGLEAYSRFLAYVKPRSSLELSASFPPLACDLARRWDTFIGVRGKFPFFGSFDEEWHVYEGDPIPVFSCEE